MQNIALISVAILTFLLLGLSHVDLPPVVLEVLLMLIIMSVLLGVIHFITNMHLQKLTSVDALTKLPARLAFVHWLDVHIAKLITTKANNCMAVFLLDLDKFKLVNETKGYPVGDRVLLEVVDRLKGVGFSNVLYRLSSDEFGVFLDIKTASDIPKICNEMLSAFNHPFLIGGSKLHITASIGVAVYPTHGVTAQGLLKLADVAMRESKKYTTNRYSLFDTIQMGESVANISLLRDLHNSLESNELQVHYQLKKAIKTGKYVGIEALIRWQHPILGMLYPDTFIRLAEQNNLIQPITMYVLERGLKDLINLRDFGFKGTLSINISPYCSFTTADLVYIENLVKIYELPPRLITFEITESIAGELDEKFINFFTDLNTFGISISIDDFGTGHSSLLYLKKLPISELKVDKSFVMGMLTNEQDYYIVKSVVILAEGMGCVCVAEGVESPEIESSLWEMGCDTAQGYHISKPLSFDNLKKRLKYEQDLDNL